LPAPAEKPGRIASFVSNVIAVRKEAEARRHEAEARRAAEAEARAKAEAEEKAQAERAAKREARKMREKPKPETVETWLSTRVVDSPGNVLPATAAHDDYAADCRARGETPVSKRGPQFVAELRKLGLDVRERGSRKRAEIHGLALAPHAAGGGLRIVSSR
jgi:hypothetical protein